MTIGGRDDSPLEAGRDARRTGQEIVTAYATAGRMTELDEDGAYERARDEKDAALWKTLLPSMRVQCAEELRLECAIGSLREAFDEYRAEHGDVSAKEYVEMLERSHARAWTDRLDVIFTDLEAAI